MGKGIDYGMGTTNIDRATGIRYGVISQNEVLQSWCDSSEPDYGEPTCPECGNEAITIDETMSLYGYQEMCGECREYACNRCRILFDSEDAFGDEPLAFTLDDGEYKAQSDSYGDIFILKSPFYTRAAFCSPCAPGACYLTDPCEDGERAYCFGHDWFEDGKAPYPVFRVVDCCFVRPE